MFLVVKISILPSGDLCFSPTLLVCSVSSIVWPYLIWRGICSSNWFDSEWSLRWAISIWITHIPLGWVLDPWSGGLPARGRPSPPPRCWRSWRPLWGACHHCGAPPRSRPVASWIYFWERLNCDSTTKYRHKVLGDLLLVVWGEQHLFWHQLWQTQPTKQIWQTQQTKYGKHNI